MRADGEPVEIRGDATLLRRLMRNLLENAGKHGRPPVEITIASDKAKFSVPEMAHQIMPTMVMSSFVDRVPRKAMAYMVYSMFEVSPERALSYGIVSDVVPAKQLDDHVERLIAAMLRTRDTLTRPAST